MIFSKGLCVVRSHYALLSSQQLSRVSRCFLSGMGSHCSYTQRWFQANSRESVIDDSDGYRVRDSDGVYLFDLCKFHNRLRNTLRLSFIYALALL